jgi:hypothetical protein
MTEFCLQTRGLNSQVQQEEWKWDVQKSWRRAGQQQGVMWEETPLGWGIWISIPQGWEALRGLLPKSELSPQVFPPVSSAFQ